MKILVDAVTAGAKSALRTAGSGNRSRADAPAPDARRAPVPGSGYPGDFTGVPRIEYAPHPDGDADPGEVVWGWVAYEDDPTQGKDRPLLVVGRDAAGTGAAPTPGGTGDLVLALMLSSQDYHDGDPAWLPLGSGGWDSEGRPSWVRLDRVLELPADGIRREGAILDRARFERVAAALRADHGWA